MIHYMQKLDMNANLEIVLKFAIYPLKHDGNQGLKVTLLYQFFCNTIDIY